MEDVLEVYRRPYNPRFSVICMDEASKQLVGEVPQPLPMHPVIDPWLTPKQTFGSSWRPIGRNRAS